MKTLTDAKGQFEFPPLKPGNYHLWAEEKTQTRVSSVPLPLPILVEGGKVSNIAINFEPPCLLSGKIPILELRDNILVPSGFLKNTTLSLESATTGKRLFVQTDENGSFSYTKIPSGRWHLTIQKENLPDYHYLEPKEFLLDLFPGEEKIIEIKVLPIKRQLRIIDTDTIYSPGPS